MALTSHVLEQDFPPPPEPGLTPSEIIARAEAMVPTLVERQAETEERTFYAPDTHEAFAAAGFYRILVPRRYGGYEFGLGTFMRVVMTLARGCPSTGWMYCLGAAHALVAATLFEERAQAEFFGAGDFICPAVVAATGTAERADDGHWVVNGTWAYCSGAPYATHFIGHALVAGEQGQPPRPLMFLIPRDRLRVLDDWGRQLGLKGSGSHSITVENARIPDHFVLDATHLSDVTVTGGTPGLTLHGNPQYGGAPLSSMAVEGAALAVGMAQGALDVYEELVRTKQTLTPPIVTRADSPDYQLWYGKAFGMVAAAEAMVLSAIQQWDDLCARGPAAFTVEEDFRIAMICRESAALAWRAVEEVIQPTAGSGAVRAGERLERIWRDLSTGHSHAGFAVLLTTTINRALAQIRLGRQAAEH
ncbi:acyl-CoA dehydrogenase family protein [Streptosporangium sp. NPDC051022]|uniref:acyl-CoA dehydrogenase family protein n=1 Tax=Streptosporangium sp. NPDC051022 TaxID=3155752 RepID=UPI00341872AD